MEAITQEDPALAQLKQQATQMQQNYEQTIAELKNQITLLKTQAIAADTRNKETMAKAQLDNATKLAIEQMKQQGENDRKAAEMVNDNMKDLQNPMIDGGVL